jgi:aminoglycoside phosphotransferase (APT) family kinase protein
MELSSKLIAVGRTAEIYAWEDGRILKLLRPGFPPFLIEQEERITSAIVQAGIAAPKIYNVVEVNGRPGIVYERIDGPSLAGNIEHHPFQLKEHATLLARLHVTIHTHTYSHAAEGSPRQKRILVYQVQEAQVLPEAMRNAVLFLLDSLPDGDTLCHNDFHPLNVLMGPGGPVIIDWESASLGNPCADVARTSLTVALGRPLEGFSNFWMKKVAEFYLRAFTTVYLASYRAFAHDPLPDLRAWQTVQAAAKVQYEALANQGMWIEVIKKGLKKYDKLSGC